MKKDIIDTSFVKMAKQGIIGAFSGIISGYLLGIFIYGLQLILNWIGTFGQPAYSNSYMMVSWPGLIQLGTLGACFGAIIGAVFGCIVGLKDIQKK